MRERERESARVRARGPFSKGSVVLFLVIWEGGGCVYPTRRDQRGRRFGFARMAGAFDVKDMERRLNQIWLDSYRLKVKVAENMKEGKVEFRVAQNRKEEKQWVRRDARVTPGRSYAQAVAASPGAVAEGLSSNKGNRQLMAMREMEETADGNALEGVSMKASAVILEKASEKLSVPLITEGVAGATSPIQGDLVLEFLPSDEEVAWLNRSMVAVVRSLDMVRQIQHRMDVDGLMVNVALLGGRQIILVDNSEGCLVEFMENNKELTELWFEWVQPTSLSTVSAVSRLAWLRFSGVPLHSWSERCFAELGGLIGEVILVDEDTKSKSFLCEGRVLILCETRAKISASILLKVGHEAFPIEVAEEEWRMDPDWWLAGERRNPTSESVSEYSSDEGSESGLIATGFCGEDEAMNGDIQAVTDAATEGGSFENFELMGMEMCGLDGADLVGLAGDDLIGPKGVDMVGPATTRSGEQRAVGGCVSGFLTSNDVLQQQGEKKNKRSRDLGSIYAGNEGIGDAVDGKTKLKAGETSWVTARTKCRRDRRSKANREVPRPELQTGSFSLSDGCIQNRNRVIRQQIQLEEVQKLFMLGQRLGVKCQENEDEVLSRGLGSVVKRKEVSKLVRKESPDFLFIQETKLEQIDMSVCRLVWNSDDFEWVMQKSNGNSGGMLCIWNKRNFVKQRVVEGQGFIGISREWGQHRIQCTFVNVYAPCDRQRRVVLWGELSRLVLDEGGRWLLAGDFNAVRNSAERKGRMGETQDMEEFNLFVQETGLVDIRLRNRKFTWYRPDGTSMSRLDRFLLSTEMSCMEGDWIQEGIRRSISDHCAIILKSRGVDWGPKPFRVLDVWQHHNDFRKFIDERWKTMQIEGWAAYKCKQKLKLLKEECKRWNDRVFGNVEARSDKLRNEIERLDKKCEVEGLNEAEVKQRREAFQELGETLKQRELVWKQKSRAKWARFGDANTAFFHRSVHARRAQNTISGIYGDNGWVEEPELVKAEAVKYFTKVFQNEQWCRPTMDGISFRRISEEQREWLERPFTIEKIEEGLNDCDGSKAPGPDGFNFNFVKFAWSTVKDDFVNFVTEFHRNGRLVNGLNSSFLALIPKKMNPEQFKEYRPISLIGCLYKLLAKVLANRLKMVMEGIISESQAAFIGGRQLVDSVLVLNEVVHEVKWRKQECFILKADFEKAYDCVDWGFLDWMMNRMGFGVKWRKWMLECLSTSRISILINGSPTNEFPVRNGLRQGDPLSPFLFLLVAEGLCGLVKKAESEGLLKGVEIGRGGTLLSLLQFADDTVFMGKADVDNLRVVKAILNWFQLISGLKINFGKSYLYGFNVSEGWVKGAADILRCGVGKMPFTYLGLPVGGNSGRRQFWNPVLDRFRQKLASWKSPLLSFGGRITLINSVLSALPIFYLSLFKIPKGVLREMIKIQRSFFWGGVNLDRKIAWVSWEYVCMDKGKGGLGVADLERRNCSLLGKWWYRLGDGVDGLWKRVLWEKYYGGRKEVDVTSVGTWNMSGVWKDIVGLGRRSERLEAMLGKGFKWKVGNGSCVDFWHDKWVGDKPLRNLFPRLYALAITREGLLKDMGFWSAETWIWDCRWRRNCVGRGVGAEEQFRELINRVGLHRGKADSWSWIHSADGVYSAKKAYDFLSPKCSILDEKWSRVLWGKYVPSKLSIFGWRLLLNRLATKDNLCRRGVVVPGGNVCCEFCHEGVEHLQHIFCECKAVWLVWRKVLGWWGVQSPLPKDVFGLADVVVAGINGECWTEVKGLKIKYWTLFSPNLFFGSKARNKAAVSPIQIGFYVRRSARRP
ncbi:hypothetical protein SLEP1_g3431 [Rubroshorea leprosula]|uniref:Reverse transcriptase domain-containing protein n=1 Tax=Rubroshorea leprosula TaxID=152421 RepID=A0AAV5HKX6_9ROSI|nr:hypothetical protein SLEP1_g3431 [Rubroshorea leprosula]